MIVATAGHVDHGKTRLVKALTGVDTDRTAEEKRRGLTIDLGFAYLDRPDGGEPLGFVDVPGHERFLRNMLAGVAAIDVALLVVAADEGPMPQTREHLAIMTLLGIPRALVALTRTDLAEPARLEQARAEVETLLASSAWGDSPIVPVSAASGDGVQELRNHLFAIRATPAETGRCFRLAVDRSFTLPGTGLVATGTVATGTVGVGDKLLISPAGLPVRVRGLHAQGRAAETATAGQRCALNLAGSSLRNRPPRRGDWLVAPDAQISVQRIDAQLRVLPDEEHPLGHWTPVHVHLGAAAFTGRVATLERGAIAPGEQGLVQLVLNAPANVRFGDRFIVRDQSARRTIGGGQVLDPFGPRRGRAKPWRLQQLQALEAADDATALQRLLDASATGVVIDAFIKGRNLEPAAAETLLQRVPSQRIPLADDHLAFSPQHWKGLRQKLLDTLCRLHEQSPDSVGPDEASLANALGLRVPRPALASALRELIQDKAILRRGFCLSLPDHEPRLSRQDRDLLARITVVLQASGLRPPITGDLAESLGMEKPALLEKLEHYVRLGHLERVADNRYFLPETVQALTDVARQLAEGAPDGTFSAADYRDRSGIGRNLTIQVLEYLDRAGITLFVEERRRMRQ